MQHIVHRISITTAALFLLLQTAVPLLYSADFYIDPVSGSPDGDGSLAQPWKSLQEVIDSNRVESMKWSSLPYDGSNQLVVRNEGAPIKGGDTIWLFDGNYESVNITGYYNTQTITLAAMDGATPRFGSILIRAGANWHLRGLSVSPSYATVYEPITMINLDSHGYHGPIRDITIEECSLQSVPDVSGWSLEDWNQLAASGIAADGTNIIIRNNRVRNVNFGISVTASHSLVQSNVIENFSGDGLRGPGNYTTFDSNTVKNCYDVNANHDDGFQSWSYKDGQVFSDAKKIVTRIYYRFSAHS
ncbi:hypothetical protein [Desulfopila sp. IMCC35008]|uniref:hypothetical protein n=1 Tax=Desulfopila sp. IMCC35008 TaxID=2653858 RepID=UPI0013D4B9FE|nr:hypothetical protein [Desulfopila sp. IMCC35008]